MQGVSVKSFELARLCPRPRTENRRRFGGVANGPQARPLLFRRGQNRFGVGLELDLSDRLHGYGNPCFRVEVLLWRHVERHQLLHDRKGTKTPGRRRPTWRSHRSRGTMSAALPSQEPFKEFENNGM